LIGIISLKTPEIDPKPYEKCKVEKDKTNGIKYFRPYFNACLNEKNMFTAKYVRIINRKR